MSKQIAGKLEHVPDEPGAYMMLDASGEVIYVGKAASLRKRLQQWLRPGEQLSAWASRMVECVRDFDYIVTGSELEALALEYNLIKEREPHYNIKLADDKSYPYLLLTDEPYPRLTVVRDLPEDAQVPLPGRFKQERGLHDPKRHEVLSLRRGRVFGPYPSARAMRRTMRVVGQLFGLRSCRRKLIGEPCGRPCLNYHIKRCVGPCTGDVAVDAYGEIVEQVALFLEGRCGDVLKELHAQMRESAEKLQFERAAQLRDRLQALEKATEGQAIVATEEREQDAVAAAMDEGRATVELLSVRRGRLLEKEQFDLEGVGDRSEGEVLGEFLARHYGRAHVPREVLLSHPVEDPEEWERVLTELRGQKVRVSCPQRGQKRRLVELSLHNAELALRRGGDADAAMQQAAAAALDELATALGLEERPARIECYDISNTQGREATGSMVVFAGGVREPSSFRRFRVRGPTDRPDDYAMMHEVAQRRLRRAAEGDEKFLPLPDLIVVDGGKGQLNVICRALASWELQDVSVVALAKREEQVFVPGVSDPVDMTAHTEAQMLLQRIRDEAHRFAVEHHRGLRDRRVTESELERAPQIGPARRKALLTTFGSVAAIRGASLEDLAAVPGMTAPAARALKQFLNGAETAGEATSPRPESHI
jgi:excinuclease ABC subunit C